MKTTRFHMYFHNQIRMRDVLRPLGWLLLLLLTGCGRCADRPADSGGSMSANSPSFGAYYTQLDPEDPDSSPYADIIVTFDQNYRLAVARQYDYAPIHEVQNTLYPLDDLVARTPVSGDKTFLDTSYARIIENAPEQALIHIRYLPQGGDFDSTQIAHETLLVEANGRITRTVQEGTPATSQSAWKSPTNQHRQVLQLNTQGFQILSTTEPTYEHQAIAITPAPLIDNDIQGATLQMRFDEGDTSEHRFTLDETNNERHALQGREPLFKTGVSGTALAFDGYTTHIDIPQGAAPSTGSQWTIDLWVAPGARPFSYAPFVAQNTRNAETLALASGYFFGLLPNGHAAFAVVVDNAVQEIQSTAPLPLNTWSHLSIAVDTTNASLALYLDGALDQSHSFASGSINEAVQASLRIGLGSDPLPPLDPQTLEPMGEKTSLGFEGLIDEVRFYGRTLTSDDVANAHSLIGLDESARIAPDLNKRSLPTIGQLGSAFAASHVELSYHDLWDTLWREGSYPDLVARFSAHDAALVFWRGNNFAPTWVLEDQKWFGDRGAQATVSCPGCIENDDGLVKARPQNDWENRYSHIRLLQNHAARIKIHWRYALVDPLGNIPTCPDDCPNNPNYSGPLWVDEFFNIYPDSTVVRSALPSVGGALPFHGFHTINAPGTTWSDAVDTAALSHLNLNGDEETLTFDPQMTGAIPQSPLDDTILQLVNLVGDTKFFMAYRQGHQNIPTCHPEKCTFKNWPVAQLHSADLDATLLDRISHTPLGGGFPHLYESMILYGFGEGDAFSQRPWIQSWVRPAGLTVESGGTSEDYIPEERSYRIIVDAEALTLRFNLAGSNERPIQNPVFELRNIQNKSITALALNGNNQNEGTQFTQGRERLEDGTFAIVVWLQHQSTKNDEWILSLSDPSEEQTP